MLIEAKQQNASQIIFVGYQFISRETKREKVEQNRGDFERFIRVFQGLEGTLISSGILLGPIKVPRGQFVPGDIPVLIGKVTTNLK
jgi:hypothetical protein